jgi:hypothetical protein
MKYKSNIEMEKKSILALELTQLEPLIGKWNFTGSFKDNPDKSVEGWETYEIVDDGKAICAGETRTMLSGNIVDLYKYSMKILFDTDINKIIAGDEWEISFDRNTLIFQNDRHRLTGKLDASKTTITAKWENMTTAGNWKYWYDQTLTKQKNPID